MVSRATAVTAPRDKSVDAGACFPTQLNTPVVAPRTWSLTPRAGGDDVGNDTQQRSCSRVMRAMPLD
jgi:hypothetical protein